MSPQKRAARAKRKAKARRSGTYRGTLFSRGLWRASKAARQMVAERRRKAPIYDIQNKS